MRGLGKVARRRSIGLKWTPSSALPSGLLTALRSTPAEKARPVPVITQTDTPGSSAAGPAGGQRVVAMGGEGIEFLRPVEPQCPDPSLVFGVYGECQFLVTHSDPPFNPSSKIASALSVTTS